MRLSHVLPGLTLQGRAAGRLENTFEDMYPQDEYNNNVANVEAALQSQFGGNDRTSDPLWWLK